ncbi:hypothetical protein CHH48_13270 [Terribacillus saccharophilus]|uniref:Uncharacterized protein n=2 Tax=Terribacillus saccharophilus TaxID=361277 RepID=A0ABX4GX50_9BACI|nr:hypothetical protein CHH56_12140 [Terribacillus saccharophilus]PAD95656.1 hypothetical protein CHH50_12375 [Terribacillus saccharophilus]PAD99426.1 hypothetical protein CHH48_13270 [Terribacillus saccharophilus]
METQYWLSNEEEDLCSHGQIHLEVDGTIITQAGKGEEWGISESALALLRTLDVDYISNPECKEGLILHGCGIMLMSGCPISIHWSVQHKSDEVFLSDFVKFTSTSLAEGKIVYPDVSVSVKKIQYEQQILQFAKQAKAFYEISKTKKIEDDFDQEMYTEFWQEYNYLLQKHTIE